MKYKAVIFDLDGTLLNTLDDLADSVNFAHGECGFKLRSIDEVRRFIGNGVRVLMRRSVPLGVSDEEYEKAYKSFVAHYEKNSRNKTAPYNGICEVLRKLKEKGYRLCIVSNKIDFAVKDLKDEFFKDLIEVAIGDSEDTRNKPAPDMVYKALSHIGVSGEDAVYVGDTDVDLETAKNSGMDCISVSWCIRSRREHEGYGAAMIADTPDDILRYV